MSDLLKFKPKTKPEGPPVFMVPRERKVWEILADHEDDAEALAVKYDVSHQTIRNVKMLKTDIAKRMLKTMTHLGATVYLWAPARRFTDEQIAAIRADKKASHIVAKKYNCSPSTIRMIKSGQTYKEDTPNG